jgi:TonB family protein
MFPRHMLKSEFSTEGSLPDLTSILEQHLHAGFQPDLALDLVLNELVIRAAEVTHANAGALALARGDELVCRAATGSVAPDLGVPISPRDGLSGVCLRTRQPQLSVDTEVDPRVAVAFSRRYGIRSVLVVPVFDVDKAEFMGVLEVFSSTPGAFTSADQYLLEAFAEECARVCKVAIELSERPAAEIAPPEPVPLPGVTAAAAKPAPARAEIATHEITPLEIAPPVLPLPMLPPRILPAPEFMTHEFMPPDFTSFGAPPSGRSLYEGWSLVLGALAILAIIGVSFVIGSRIGWLRAAASPARIVQPAPASFPAAAPVKTPAEKSGETESARAKSASAKPSRTEAKATPAAKSTSPPPDASDLVVYEKGKVVFRMKNQPAPPETANEQPKSDSSKPDDDSRVAAVSTPKIPQPRSASSTTRSVWLTPTEAEDRLVRRTEPEYPAAARATRRVGEVVLEVHVAEDGSVSSVRTVKGDPLLAAAATEAVRNWRYQPYRLHDRPSQFHTDVTLSFTLSN